MIKKLQLYFHTIRYLKPIQVFHQIKKNLSINTKNGNFFEMIEVSSNTFINVVIKELDEDLEYIKRFKPESILEGKFTFLNEEKTIELNDWYNPDKSHLWNFNLHYFEFGISLAVMYKKTQNKQYYFKFREILQAWINNNSIPSDAYHPYTISLRVPNLFVCFELFGELFYNDTDFKEKVISNIFIQYKFLEKNKEVHLLGNHYFENLKALILCNLIFNDEKELSINLHRLKTQVKEQILPDGMHFERSVMYHKIILEDLIRILYWVQQKKPELIDDMISTLNKMINCLISLEKGMGKIPLFNDAGDGIAKETHQLVNASKRLFNIKPRYSNTFHNAGYSKLYSNDISVMFDSGIIGPDYMPGHGHCDALSFEISKNEVPVFVNSGTYQYQSELRKFFRSTQAHNTLQFSNEQQSECWGEHRVARRISQVKMKKIDDKYVIGSYRNYHGNKHFRKVGFYDKEVFFVIDKVLFNGSCTIKSYLHISPIYSFLITENNKIKVIDKKNIEICTIHVLDLDNIILHRDGELTNYSPAFGLLQNKQVLEMQWDSHRLFNGYCIDFTCNLSEDIIKKFINHEIKKLDNYIE